MARTIIRAGRLAGLREQVEKLRAISWEARLSCREERGRAGAFADVLAILPDGEEAADVTVVGCYDCGLLYNDPGFCDLVVPDDIWQRISPTGDDGGILCPICLTRRVAALNLGYHVTAKFFGNGTLGLECNVPATILAAMERAAERIEAATRAARLTHDGEDER